MKKLIITLLAVTAFAFAYSQPYLELSGGTVTGDLGIGSSPSSGGSAGKWLSFDGTSSSYSGGTIFKYLNSPMAYQFYSSGFMTFQSTPSASGFQFQTNNGSQTPLKINPLQMTVSVPLNGTSASFNGQLNSGQGRFKGWYDSGDGLAGEIGVWSGEVYLYSYDRTANAYRKLNLGGSLINLESPVTGTSAIFSSALTTNSCLTTGSGGVYLGLPQQSWIWPRGTNDVAIGADNDDRLLISGTSAAFSIPLTTNSHITTGTGGIYLGSPQQSWVWPRGTNDIVIGADNDDRLHISGDAATFSVPVFGTTADFKSNVSIGSQQTGANLYVHGNIKSKEVKVEASVTFPDYVFERSYDLKSLKEVETYITENKHLPEIPSAKEIEKNGINVGEMQLGLLKKIEELTLYVIDINKQMGVMQNETSKLKQENEMLRKAIADMVTNK